MRVLFALFDKNFVAKELENLMEMVVNNKFSNQLK